MLGHFRAALLVALIAAPPLAAQQPTTARADSLAQALRALQARVDSLTAALRSLQAAAPGAPAPAASAGDDLAALRAAAASAAGTDTIKPDTAPTQFVGRERNQNQLNPEISATGDVRAYAQTSGAQGDNFDPREFEVAFQSALDPYSHTKIFVSLENGEVSVEEGYAYWIGLPGHLRFDVGKFRQQFGELNRWHLHALPETEYPLALRAYTGGDGLSAAGASLYWAAPTGGVAGTHELYAQVTRGNDDTLFLGSHKAAFLGHVNNFWQLTPSTYAQVGLSALYGTNPAAIADTTGRTVGLKTLLTGLDFRLTWRPPAQALYHEMDLRGELFVLRRDTSGVAGARRLGGYVDLTYKLSQRWIAGVRGDYVESPAFGDITRAVVPSLTYWESEWVFLRAEFLHQRGLERDPLGTPFAVNTNRLAFQAVWAIGPHKHEIY